MSRRGQPLETKDRLVRLIREDGVDLSAAARACEISTRTASRILAEVDTPQRSLPFSGEIQPPANVPPPNWGSDQPRPSHRAAFDANYHSHTFRSFSAPLSFEGFTLSRLRAAISLHRQGLFLESSNLALVCLGFAPVLAATIQRLYPAISLPRQLKHGSRGISRIIGEELEAQLVPRSGLCPSEFLPPTLFGATQFDLAFMGFSVWQHAFGDPDPETGIRPLYTRRWPTWAVQYYRYRRTFVAMTMDGPVDIVNDGKFTLIADHDEPHFLGAVLSVGEDAFSGISTRRARDTWIERYGDPKIIGTMPEGIAPNSPEGEKAMDALATIRNPGGYGLIPYGSTAQFIGLQATQGTIITDATANAVQNIAAVILGSDGTMTRGAGVYTSPIFEKVSHNIVNRDLTCIKRGINQGHIGTYLAYNYAGTIATASGWIEPVIDIPLPDPDADARIKSYAERVQKFHEILDKERANGFLVSQDRVSQLAKSLEIDEPTLAPMDQKTVQLDLAPNDVAKVVKVREARSSRGLPPLGDNRDELTIAEMDALSKSNSDEGTDALNAAESSDAPVNGSTSATGAAKEAGPENEVAKSGGAVVEGETNSGETAQEDE